MKSHGYRKALFGAAKVQNKEQMQAKKFKKLLSNNVLL